MHMFLRTALFSFALLTALPVFAAGELSVQESMQKREWRYLETPVFEVTFSLATATSSDISFEGKVVREDGIVVSIFADRTLVTSATSTTKLYGLDIPEWSAGYYYVVLNVASPQTDETIIRRVTFSIRPNIAASWVYGSTGAAALLGIALITYVLARRKYGA